MRNLSDWTVRSAVGKAGECLKAAGIEGSRNEAEILMVHILDWPRHKVFLEGTHVLSTEETTRYFEVVDRRAQFEPMAYILGSQEFYGRDFSVTPATLIPRPDTETLIDVALKRAQFPAKGGVLADLGTGTGCILLTLLSELKARSTSGRFSGVGIDISEAALKVAAGNAAALGIADMADFIQGDWFAGVPVLEDGYDCIVSNPPYITTDEMTGLMPDVRDFEPTGALHGGPDGLAPYRILTTQAATYLRPGGLLAVEIGFEQAKAVSAMFVQNHYQSVEVMKDLAGNDRVVSGFCPKN
ncbi:release factor glutamine methyltransferase [Kordiimonas sediminis]|uniref:Release factor glutamine methyltransferase n=1 Tax=Kordiimonas sediminis TaxID=1735581 RepID=A0A919AIH3_9PROT|nr:peptide chain release factor N(5)-glutamine methyltransferase [Kordiimonas sediminis]GHF10427.1 release factor glutamine methyltransferase [Kordiimonas sediminis]